MFNLPAISAKPRRIVRMAAIAIMAGSALLVTAAAINKTEARPLSGIVAVSTGPMSASYLHDDRPRARDLAAGDDVFLNDEVRTGTRTKAQVLLQDESVFSMGPGSSVVFDEFVYDPGAGDGSLTARLVGGSMRFVSGKIAKKAGDKVSLKVGKASIGIRGTEILARHSAAGSRLVLLSGEMEISSPAGTVTIARPGWGIEIGVEGTLGVPRFVPPQDFDEALTGIGETSDASGSLNQIVNIIVTAPSRNPNNQPQLDLAQLTLDLNENNQTEQAGAIVESELVSFSNGVIPANPFFVSDSKILVRYGSQWNNMAASPAYFSVLRKLLREKFPNSTAAEGSSLPQFDNLPFVYRLSGNVADSNGDLVHGAVSLDDYDGILAIANLSGSAYFLNGTLSADEQTVLANFTSNGGRVLALGEPGTPQAASVSAHLDIFQNGASYSANGQTAQTLSLAPATADNALTAGVQNIAHAHADGFPLFSFSDLSNAEALLQTSDANPHVAGYGFDSGALYIARYGCASDGSGSFGIEALGHDMEQFCANLVASLAPDDSLRDVEIAKISLREDDGSQPTYRLISGGDGLFRIDGDRLLMVGGQTPEAEAYELRIGVTGADGVEKRITQNFTISGTAGSAESKIISRRVEVQAGAAVNLVENGTLVNQQDLPDWITITNNEDGNVVGTGTPGLPGDITLHYSIGEGDTAYDRYVRLAVASDCASDNCRAFLASLDTQSPLTEGRHYSLAGYQPDFTAFYDRFTTGQGNFSGGQDIEGETGTARANLAVSINYADRQADIIASGLFADFSAADGTQASGSWRTQMNGLGFDTGCLSPGSAMGGAMCHFDSQDTALAAIRQTCTGNSGSCA
ncbi:MAG: hypothetical protein EBT71_01715, partial [Alphaproteobacteria bacterium]|nr:hypothetical protein [Alphaproteobacteria bacterium]